MSKPNISIPARFAINGTKTDFSQTKITDGFDSVDPDILAGDNLNKFIDDTYQGLNGVLELYDTKVNKSGDTMSGILQIRRESGNEFLQMYPNVSLTTPPASTRNLAMLVNYDVNSNVMAKVLQVLYSDGGNSIKLSAYRPNGSGEVAAFEVGWGANGNRYCTFPNTTCCDGQWAVVGSSVASEVSLPIGIDQRLEYDISSILPNDGYNYMVLISVDIETGSGSGASVISSVIGKDYNGYDVWGRTSNLTARGSWIMTGSSNVIIPVNTSRKIWLNYSVYSKIAKLDSLYLEAFRRIGTNG